MSTARRLHYSYAEYLSAQESSDVRLEYRAGVIYAMAGGSPEHAGLSAQVIGLLTSKLSSGCRAFSSDLKVRVPANDVTVYPDASVICGKVERAPDDKLAALNPTLVVEVTSPSTEEYDRGEKLAEYKAIKTLRSIWIVSHQKPRVTVIERTKKGWKTTEYGRGEQVALGDPPLSIDVDAIYRPLDGM